MIPSLEIRNYRLFKHLTIETLGRVNLVTGKNNVGKTSLLEALQLYSSKCSIDDIVTILTRRDELTGHLNKSYFSLCYYHNNAPISIGHYHDNNNTLTAKFIAYGNEWNEQKTAVTDTVWGSQSMVKDSVWGDLNTMINNTVGKSFLLFDPVADLLRFTLLNYRAAIPTRNCRITIKAVKQ